MGRGTCEVCASFRWGAHVRSTISQVETPRGTRSIHLIDALNCGAVAELPHWGHYWAQSVSM
eukprot:7108350-Pyramimonas_sp.AAC.1